MWAPQSASTETVAFAEQRSLIQQCQLRQDHAADTGERQDLWFYVNSHPNHQTFDSSQADWLGAPPTADQAAESGAAAEADAGFGAGRVWQDNADRFLVAWADLPKAGSVPYRLAIAGTGG